MDPGLLQKARADLRNVGEVHVTFEIVGDDNRPAQEKGRENGAYALKAASGIFALQNTTQNAEATEAEIETRNQRSVGIGRTLTVTLLLSQTMNVPFS